MGKREDRKARAIAKAAARESEAANRLDELIAQRRKNLAEMRKGFNYVEHFGEYWRLHYTVTPGYPFRHPFVCPFLGPMGVYEAARKRRADIAFRESYITHTLRKGKWVVTPFGKARGWNE